MVLEKDLTVEQADSVETIGLIKRNIPEEKWLILKKMMLAYANGMEAGIALEREERSREAV